MQHIALEGRCFVLSANQYLRRDALPADLHPVQGDEPDTVLIGGGSVIVSPLGEVLAGPLRDVEGILSAELDSTTWPVPASTSIPPVTTPAPTSSPSTSMSPPTPPSPPTDRDRQEGSALTADQWTTPPRLTRYISTLQAP